MKSLALALAAVLIAFQPTAAGYEEAMAQYIAGNYAEAGESFLEMVEQSPGYDFGHYMLGLCLAKQDKPEAAIEHLEIALQFNGDRFEYYHALAQTQMQANRPSEALAALESAEHLVGEANLYHFHSSKGLAHASLKHWEAAAQDLEIANGLLPGQRQVIDRLALSCFKLKKYKEAVPLLRQSLEIDPEAVSHHRMLAEALMRIETDDAQKEEAFQAAKSYRTRHPHDADAADLLGRAALSAGRFEEAIAAFRAVLDEEPDNCVAPINLSLAMLACRRPQGAEETLVAAEHCNAVQPQLLETLGMVRRIQGRYEEALATYERAYEIQPTASAQRALEELNHNLEVQKHNQAVEQQQQLDLEYARMLEKIERWNRLTEESTAGLE